MNRVILGILSLAAVVVVAPAECATGYTQRPVWWVLLLQGLEVQKTFIFGGIKPTEHAEAKGLFLLVFGADLSSIGSTPSMIEIGMVVTDAGAVLDWGQRPGQRGSLEVHGGR